MMKRTSFGGMVAGLMLALAAAAWIPSQDTHATTLAPLTVEQMVDASTYVVRGTVTEVWTEVNAAGHVVTRARVSVAHVVKGRDNPTEIIVDSMGGTLGEQSTVVDAAARFSKGEEVLMFLDQLGTGRFTPVGMFMGKLTVRRAPGDQRSLVMRWHGSPHESYDARFLPFPSPENRVYEDDILSRIEQRLDAGWDGNAIPGISNERLAEINAPEWRKR